MTEQFAIVSPVNGELYATRAFATEREIAAALANATTARALWKETPVDDRIAYVGEFLDALDRRREELAESVTWQMGRPLHKADELGRMRSDCARFMETARLLAEPLEQPSTPGIHRYVRREPVGVCLAISAWNYPAAMASYLIVAPMLAGNVIIYKHAQQTAIVAELLAEAFREAGLPDGVFQAIHLTHADVARTLTTEAINRVHFIGSTRSGKAVQKAASQSPLFLVTSLELGGKDPSYVRADAEIDKLLPDMVEGCFGNSGQSCTAVERIYVDKRVYADFVDGFVATAEEIITLGHPFEEAPYIGPVVSAGAVDSIKSQINEAIDGGARNLLPEGRFDIAREGTAYVEPSILVDVEQHMRVVQEETFGPSVSIIPVDSDQQALELMNDSIYGLTASIWTQDLDAYTWMADRIDAGTVYLNRCDHCDILLPSGGYRQSGTGRINGGLIGFEGMTQVKSYHVRSEW